jgi:hypothetical protein
MMLVPLRVRATTHTRPLLSQLDSTTLRCFGFDLTYVCLCSIRLLDAAPPQWFSDASGDSQVRLACLLPLLRLSLRECLRP